MINQIYRNSVCPIRIDLLRQMVERFFLNKTLYKCYMAVHQWDIRSRKILKELYSSCLCCLLESQSFLTGFRPVLDANDFLARSQDGQMFRTLCQDRRGRVLARLMLMHAVMNLRNSAQALFLRAKLGTMSFRQLIIFVIKKKKANPGICSRLELQQEQSS